MQQNTIAWHHIKKLLLHLQRDVHDHLNKLETRERFLNSEFAVRTEEFRNKKESFEAIKVLRGPVLCDSYSIMEYTGALQH